MIIAQEITENGEVILRYGSAGYEIIVDGQFLMSTASGNSSKALVELGLAQLTGQSLKVLIGGLGLGFSLKAALDNSNVTAVTVVELEAQIIDWHRRDLIPGSAKLFNDLRTRVLHQNFLRFCEDCQIKFNLIALDIDNGPEWLSHETNSTVYNRNYLRRLSGMLEQESILTIWSAAESPGLMQTLDKIFVKVTEVAVADHNGEGRRIPAFIYVCKSPRKGYDHV